MDPLQARNDRFYKGEMSFVEKNAFFALLLFTSNTARKIVSLYKNGRSFACRHAIEVNEVSADLY